MQNNKNFDLITIGENLIELSSSQNFKDAECLHKYYGGDSLVTAIAAARLNSKVGFITCVGDDAFKDYLLSSWMQEGIDTKYVKTVNANNGFYMVSRPSNGVKEFIHYRKKIAPSFLSIDEIEPEYISSSKIIYASGITQSLSITAREAVKKAFNIAKENGVLTAYDPNFTSLLSTIDNAKEYFEEISNLIDIIFMSEKHDLSIFDIDSKENLLKYLNDIGISTCIIKSGNERGYFVRSNGVTNFIKFYSDTVVDTTSTGDVFNGAFLYAIANGYNATEAAKIGSIDSGLQAQGVGAVKSVPYHDEVLQIYNSEVI